ncbi:MAG TPA: META domain-containing protein [Gemmatimonadaceae bacterium]|nr:META domain-containing protein [Gemmatimonadaceae bacterium]
MRLRLLLLPLPLLAACARSPESEGAGLSVERLAGVEWELVALGERSEVLAAGGRRPTIQFTIGESRVGGFGGCNQWSAPYQTAGDSLTFGPAVSTKMACSEGMDVETAFFGMLPSVRRLAATDSTLTLLSADSPLAQFRRAAP